MKKSLLAAASAALVLGALHTGTALAAPLTACSTSDVKVTSVGQYSSTSADATITMSNVPAVNAAACAGGFSGNDMPLPTTNLGYAGDGLLNGAAQTTGQQAGNVPFPGGAFNTLYSYSDLDGDGQADDPGWIFLGRVNFGDGGTGFEPAAIGGDASIVLASFFSVTLTGAGKGIWSFTPDATVAARALEELGKNYFDQFALVFKQSTQFAAYDFTAAQFGIAQPSADDPIFNFGGTFDVSNTLRPAGLSHISLWARDPGFTSTTELPEPGSLALLGLGALGLAAYRKRMTKG